MTAGDLMGTFWLPFTTHWIGGFNFMLRMVLEYAHVPTCNRSSYSDSQLQDDG